MEDKGSGEVVASDETRDHALQCVDAIGNHLSSKSDFRAEDTAQLADSLPQLKPSV